MITLRPTRRVSAPGTAAAPKPPPGSRLAGRRAGNRSRCQTGNPIRRLCALIAAVAMFWSSQGAADAGLNEARVAVADNRESTRLEALPRALQQVFTKLTGHRQLAAPAVQAELANAAGMVSQYRYDTGREGRAPVLWVRFDAAAVNAAFQRAGLSPWPGQRPSPLLWMVRPLAGRVELLAAGAEDGLDLAVAEAAWLRGMTLHLPLLDMEDRIAVQPGDVAAMDPAALLEASRRYPDGPLVMAAAVSDTAGWRLRWRMLDAGEDVSFDSSAADLAAAAAAGVDLLADRLAERYALSSRSVEEVEIAVSGIRAVADYGRLMNYLKGLGGVSDVTVLKTSAEGVRLRMKVAGGADGFARMVALSGVLAATDAGFRLSP